MKKGRAFLYKVPQLIILAAVVAFVSVRAQTPPAESQENETGDVTPVTLSQVRMLYPDAASFEYNSQPDAMCAALNGTGETIGSFLVTTPYADDIKGHGGPVPLLIGIDADGKIKGVKFLPNGESGGFVKIVTAEGILDAWNGLAVDEALEKEVDAVSGATLTSTAVIESFKKRLFFFLDKQ